MRGRIGVDRMIDRNDQMGDGLGASIEIQQTINATPPAGYVEPGKQSIAYYEEILILSGTLRVSVRGKLC